MRERAIFAPRLGPLQGAIAEISVVSGAMRQ